MAGLAGKTGTATLAGNLHLKLTRWTFNPTAAAVDVTGMSSGGYQEFVEGLKGATLTFDANWETTSGGGQSGTPYSILTGGIIVFSLTTDSVPARTIGGNCIVTSAPTNTAHEGRVDYSVEATVTGIWTET